MDETTVLKHQLESYRRELVDLKLNLHELQQACDSVRNDYTWGEVKGLPPSVQFCWELGRERHEYRRADSYQSRPEVPEGELPEDSA